MEYIIGIILLFTFFGLAYYCIKGHNLMIGFLIITLIWTINPSSGRHIICKPGIPGVQSGSSV